jgi:hypothetical protein
VQGAVTTAEDFIRKKENNSFDLEANNILDSITAWHKIQVNPLNQQDIKNQWENYKINILMTLAYEWLIDIVLLIQWFKILRI